MKVDEILSKYDVHDFPEDKDVRVKEAIEPSVAIEEKWQHKVGKNWYGFGFTYDIPVTWIKIIDEFLDHVNEVDPGFKIHQIKIKCGGLRCYLGCKQKLQEEINKLENALQDERLIW